MNDVIAFTRGVPPEESFPTKQLIACADRVLRSHGDDILQYGSAAGYGPLRESLAQKYAVTTDRLIIGQGSLGLLDMLCRVTLNAGEPVFVEQPTYDRTLTVLKRAQAALHGFYLNNGQMDLKEIRTSLESGIVPKYFYVIPDFQNPNGSVMGLNERMELIRLAKKYRFLIIEDTPYRHLRYEGKAYPSLFELAPDVVIHMSSFSKLVSPGMRIGFMILPSELVDRMITFANDTYISPNFLSQAVVHEFFEQGTLNKHIEQLISLYRPRLQVLLSEMDAQFEGVGSWVKPQGGFFVGLHLDEDINEPVDLEFAASNGLMLTDGRGFFMSGGNRFIRLPFCALTEKQIQLGVERLGKIIHASS
jgi:2-aminoadipate transaminase